MMKRTDMYDASVHVHTYPRACAHTTYTNTGRYAQMCTHIQTSILALSLSLTHTCMQTQMMTERQRNP